MITERDKLGSEIQADLAQAWRVIDTAKQITDPLEFELQVAEYGRMMRDAYAKFERFKSTK
jgi:hypothetical protein